MAYHLWICINIFFNQNKDQTLIDLHTFLIYNAINWLEMGVDHDSLLDHRFVQLSSAKMNK
jgi:hypothetical protein